MPSATVLLFQSAAREGMAPANRDTKKPRTALLMRPIHQRAQGLTWVKMLERRARGILASLDPQPIPGSTGCQGLRAAAGLAKGVKILGAIAALRRHTPPNSATRKLTDSWIMSLRQGRTKRRTKKRTPARSWRPSVRNEASKRRNGYSLYPPFPSVSLSSQTLRKSAEENSPSEVPPHPSETRHTSC